MDDLIYCEFLKLKNSKMFLISILGAIVTPLMIFAGILKAKLSNESKAITYTDIFEQSNLYVMLIFGLIVYSVIASYLFYREYTENTLKTILTIPISKISFIIGKYLMLLFWLFGLTAVTWVFTLLFGIVSNADNFSFSLLLKYLFQYFTGAIFLWMTITPFVCITLCCKNIVAPIIVATAVAMANLVLTNESLAVYFPWSASYIIVSGKLGNYDISMFQAIMPIIIVAIAGFVFSIVYFIKEDVR